jgi:hypothetical protein
MSEQKVMQSESREEKEKEVVEEIPEYLEPLPVSRNKGPARCYFVMMAVIYLVLLLMAVVALGSFGIKQSEITRRQIKLGLDRSQTCILFAQFQRTTTTKDGQTVHIKKLQPPGVCGYVLWGLISITIVAFVWFIYSIVLAVMGPKM